MSGLSLPAGFAMTPFLPAAIARQRLDVVVPELSHVTGQNLHEIQILQASKTPHFLLKGRPLLRFAGNKR